VTFSVQATLVGLLEKSTIQRADIAALAIGTTHFLNAIIELDSSRVEKVAVIRLASYNFSAGTPPFADWPAALKRIINGHSAIIPGGCNIDGNLITPIDKNAVSEQAGIIKAAGLKNVVIVGIGSTTDEKYYQEDQVRDILRELLGEDVNIVCSRTVAGSGLLARENASILNASILNFAQRTIRSFIRAMRHVALHCPLYLTSNAGNKFDPWCRISGEIRNYTKRLHRRGYWRYYHRRGLYFEKWVSSPCQELHRSGRS